MPTIQFNIIVEVDSDSISAKKFADTLVEMEDIINKDSDTYPYGIDDSYFNVEPS